MDWDIALLEGRMICEDSRRPRRSLGGKIASIGASLVWRYGRTYSGIAFARLMCVLPPFPLRPRKPFFISMHFPLATLLGAPEDSTKDSCAHDTVRGR